MRLSEYFSVVEAYISDPLDQEGADRLMSVQALWERVGRNLDRASCLISSELRWKYADGKDYDFGALCSPRQRMEPVPAEQTVRRVLWPEGGRREPPHDRGPAEHRQRPH
jgi:hypothetical protein